MSTAQSRARRKIGSYAVVLEETLKVEAEIEWERETALFDQLLTASWRELPPHPDGNAFPNIVDVVLTPAFTQHTRKRKASLIPGHL